jgi:hypothetical protein
MISRVEDHEVNQSEGRRSLSPRAIKRLKTLAVVGGLGITSTVGMWVAIHRYPALTGTVVDGVRKVVGPKPIAWAEDTAYGFQDKYNRWR